MVRKHLGFRPYALAACAPWPAFQHSGIHPALALSPIVLTIPHANVNFAVFSEADAQLHNLLNDIERKLKRPVEVILVFFILANAGAELYRRLAGDLMASEAPAELNEMEAMQYQMLLEEEAYPFEEKAIAMHEHNHQRLAEGVFDEWVEQSLQVLAKLFPGRYARAVRWMSLNEESNDGA
jgi:hypothetical protein